MDTRAICDERLTRWKELLVADNATPIVLIGVGHEHNSGQIDVCFPTDAHNAEIAAILLEAADALLEGE